MPFLLFLSVLLLYLTMLSDFVFVDETDVFYGGYNVIFSGDIYKVYPSQHMPFSYYMSAICALFGATTANQFRFGLYVILAGLWTSIYLHHRKHLNNWALLGLPFFYVFQLKQQELATSMISDHWQGIGLVILILEVLRYRKTWRIPVSTAVFVSLGIVLSLGTAFVSAYSVFAVFVGVLLMQAYRLWKHKEERKIAVREDLRLVCIGIAPFAILGLWYLISGNMKYFFGGAYELNVDIYSKYIGGFGSDAGGASVDTFTGWFLFIKKSIETLAIDPAYGTILILQSVTLVVFSIVIMKDNLLAGLTVLFASILAGIREFSGFHGMPYMAVCSVPMAFWLGSGLVCFVEKRNVVRGINLLAALAMVVVLVAPSMDSIHNLKKVSHYLAEPKKDETALSLPEVLADTDDRIATDDISITSWKIMRSRLKLEECSMAASNAWFYEYYGPRALEKLKENKTPIVLLNPDGAVWGYPEREYAADYVQYVESNYVQLETNVYVLQERLPEKMKKLDDAGYGLIDSKEEVPLFSEVGNQFLFGEQKSEYFIACGSELRAVRVKTATYYGNNQVGLKCEVLDAQTKEIISEFYRERESIWDNDYVRFPMKVTLEPGKGYIIRLTADKPEEHGENTLLNIYQSESGTATGLNYAIMEEGPMDYRLAVQIEYAVNEKGEIINTAIVQD